MSNNSALSKEFVLRQHKRLKELRAELLGAEENALREVNNFQQLHGDEAREYEDEAQAMDRKEMLQAKHDVDHRRLGNIDRALQKVELGTYGPSDASGEPIPVDRLEAVPEAVLTVEEAASAK